MNNIYPEALPSPRICSLLFRLGLTPNYTGFLHTAFALELALQHPQSLCLITKWLYPTVAKRCNTSAFAVERNIRLAASRIWLTSPQELSELSPTPLFKKPSNSVFLALLCSYLSA